MGIPKWHHVVGLAWMTASLRFRWQDTLLVKLSLYEITSQSGVAFFFHVHSLLGLKTSLVPSTCAVE